MVSLLITLAQDRVHGPGAARVLVLRNSRGDTALHVAARHGCQAVVERLVVAAPALSCGVNDAGVSPLYLAVSRRSAGIVKALVGRRHAAASASGPNGQNALHAAVLQSADFILPWKGVEMKEWIEKLSKNLGIVAVLIATIALTAMFNVPGGYDSEGMPNLRGTFPYNAFLVLDTVAVASSMIATMLLIYGRGAAARSSAAWICLALIFLWCALMGMILSFMAAVVPGLDNAILIKRVMWCIFALPFFSLVVLSFVWAAPAPTITSVGLLFHAQIREDRMRTRRHAGRRFPLVGFYLGVLYLFWFLNAMAFAFTLHIIMITV
ncbi:unnamed protein product [Triticum turgidum subsp. durum]|uniref:PGG domain-containing protein n=1 Tax=Triticum turgidum subsp. durum TaxID=4567 RepID=A0A9R0SQC0_TRITD|nr:unnamed protein product [Triticum turgidum subsp. durum]